MQKYTFIRKRGIKSLSTLKTSPIFVLVEIVQIAIVAGVAAILTFYSGFGLGTLLTPVLLLYFTPTIAIALTAIVHLANNVLKLLLTKGYLQYKVLFWFGLPSLIGALVGAWALQQLAHLNLTLYTYHWGGLRSITLFKLVLGLLIVVFVLIDYIPYLKNKTYNAPILGGLLSGFFGGLTGNQGALRTMFLRKLNLSKEAFIATGVAIACVVDVARLSQYSFGFISQLNQNTYTTTLLAAILAAFAGTLIGNRLLTKVTMPAIQNITAIMLVGIGLGLALGVL